MQAYLRAILRKGPPPFVALKMTLHSSSGRTVRKISIANSSLSIGGFPAVDYLGDGSLYLLDVPGVSCLSFLELETFSFSFVQHCPGHMAALARVTPTSLILLAGDTFHAAGQIRPSPHLHDTFPVPHDILERSRKSIAREYFWAPDDTTDLSNRTIPFLSPPTGTGSFYFDPVVSRISEFKLGVFDSDPNVFVLSAHDPSLHGVIDLFPKNINDWKAKGWKNRGVWSFADPTNHGYRLS
jgi:hypothetical protein